MKKKIVLYVHLKNIYISTEKKSESSVASVCIGTDLLSRVCLPKLTVYHCKFTKLAANIKDVQRFSTKNLVMKTALFALASILNV
jgi:hypothetical protein